MSAAKASYLGTVTGYSGEQLVIAGTITNAAAELRQGTRAATIAVMTGMG